MITSRSLVFSLLVLGGVTLPALAALLRGGPRLQTLRRAALLVIASFSIGLIFVVVQGRLLCFGDDTSECGGSPSYWAWLTVVLGIGTVAAAAWYLIEGRHRLTLTLSFAFVTALTSYVVFQSGLVRLSAYWVLGWLLHGVALLWVWRPLPQRSAAPGSP